MRLGATYTPTHHYVKTLAATFSRPNPESLHVREVLAHPRAAFHPCTYGLREGVAAVTAVMIKYDDLGLLPQ
jgi:hypothetical protein